jgi:hypothetical protein
MQITITSSSPTAEIEVEKHLKKEENKLIFETTLCKFGSKCKKDSCRFFHAKIKKNKIVVKRKQVKFGFFFCQAFEKENYCKHQSNCQDLHCEIKENLKIYKTECNVTPILACGAGILPFSLTDENEVFFLLGKEKKNKYVWCDFGGSYSPEDKSPLFTAAREAAEETMGLLGRNLDEITEEILTKENLAISINYLEGLLMRKKGVYNHIIEDNYHQYICHIPWIDEELLNQAIVVNRKKDYKLRHVEKLQYKWVKGMDLLKIIEQYKEEKLEGVGVENDGKIESMRKSFISSLKICYPSVKEIVGKYSN